MTKEMTRKLAVSIALPAILLVGAMQTPASTQTATTTPDSTISSATANQDQSQHIGDG
jgi:hypothetical protein